MTERFDYGLGYTPQFKGFFWVSAGFSKMIQGPCGLGLRV